MSRGQIILTVALAVLTTVLIPLLVAEVRYRNRQASRLTKVETLLEFLQTYLLKNAVLEFHNNPNPETDAIIEKINRDEPLTMEERKKLEAKLEGIVEQGANPKKEMKARNTLELLRVFEDFHESIHARTRARNKLFAE